MFYRGIIFLSTALDKFSLTAFFVTMIFFLVPFSVKADRILRLTPGNDFYQIAPYLDILEDKDKKWDIGDVSSPQFSKKFNPARSQTLNLGITSSAWWARFTIQESPSGISAGAGKKEWFLESSRPFITSFKIYLPEIDNEGSETGNWILSEHGFSDRQNNEISFRKPLLFPLPEKYESPATIYLRFEDITSIFLPLTILTESKYMNQSKHRMLFLGIYLGIIAALALYNLFLFSSLKDRSYLWYSLYVIFLALYFLGTTGSYYKYFSNFTPEKDIRLSLLFLGIALLGAGQFTRSFLMTKLNATKSDRMIMILMASTLVLIMLTPIAGVQILHTSFSYLGLAAPILIIGAGIVCWRQGFRPARFFLMAWMMLCVGGLVFDLTVRGIIPFGAFTFYSLQIGSSSEAILLSFALADRIKTMQHEREEARHGERRYLKLAITDSLTGLYNYRYFRSQIGLEIKRTESLAMPLSLILMDVDDFKKYNDSYGHPAGDKFLASLGGIIYSSIRDSDVGCRYGGEEFALILPGTKVSDAAEVAERIRSTVEKKICTPSPNEKARLTLSIGVAEHIPGQDPPLLILRADKALYQAKHQGKNRTALDRLSS